MFVLILSISWDVIHIKIQSLKSDTEEYLISCATHLSIIVGDSMIKKMMNEF